MCAVLGVGLGSQPAPTGQAKAAPGQFPLWFDGIRRERIMHVAILDGSSDGADDQIDGMVSALTAVTDDLLSA